jgi:hypothetical protein
LVSECAPKAAVKEGRSKVYQYRGTLKDKALRQYQQEWIRDRRHQKILIPGWQQALDSCRNDLFRSICFLVPERGRLAEMMASDEDSSKVATWQAIQDIYSLCIQDSTVIYLPGHKPEKGACPVATCQLVLAR